MYGDESMGVFFDDEIFAVEPGIPGVHSGGVREYEGVSITSGLQGCVDLDGQGSYIHYDRGYGMGDYCSQTPLPHEEPIEMEPSPGRAGMDYMWGWEGDDYYAEGGETLPYTISALTRLYDDDDAFEDPLPPWGNGCKARFYGVRRGGYFCVSYGGKAVNVLGAGEYAMDLNKTDTEYNWELFSTGEARYTQVASAGDALEFAGSASLGLGMLSLAAPPLSTTAAGTFAVLSVVFGAIDAVDQATPSADDQALGMMYRVHLRHTPSQENPAYQYVTEWPQYGSASTPWISRPIEVEQQGANVGDKLCLFGKAEKS